jgi:hypothetical protein
MKNFALFARKPQSTVSVDAVRRGPTLIDPKDFKYVGGGLPKTTWGKGAAATKLPNTTW